MTQEERDQLRRDDCRAIVLQYLHARPTVAQSADVIASVLRSRGHDFSAEELTQACSYWLGHCDVERIFKPGQNTAHYRITAKGTDTYERSRV
jgi:hypothetical protein